MFQYTEEQLKEWKEKHGENNVFEITVEDKKCVLRKPNRKDLSYALAASSGGKDAVKMNEALLNNCWIDGDKEMRDDDTYFFAVAEKIQGMMEAKEAELKKL